jgi:hypothetical protein
VTVLARALSVKSPNRSAHPLNRTLELVVGLSVPVRPGSFPGLLEAWQSWLAHAFTQLARLVK